MAINRERLRELLSYEPETGVFRWKVTRNQHALAGDEAGNITNDGYREIMLDGKEYMAHRLAFLYQTGAWPSELIDHVNCDPADNRWSNLREATRSQNSSNARLRKDNKLGVKGVTRNGKNFAAHIRVNRELIYLGTYTTIEMAKSVRDRAARDLHGDYSRS